MSHHLKPIEQQVIVITGATSGIGLATALVAAERGARVVLAARNAQSLQDIVEEIVESGGKAIRVVADVADRDAVEHIAHEAIHHYGAIDTWVNNAGVSVYGKLDEVSQEDHRRVFDVNFWGVVNGSLAALPHLERSHGALINVGSELSDAVIPLQGMYSSSKHAVKGFTDALRVEIERVDEAPVSITLIQPTAVNTPFPEHARNYMDSEPRLPTPQIDPVQVADAILKAATRGGRDVKVGAVSRLDTFVSKLMPSLADRLSALQVDRQQRDMPPQESDGNLYRPGEGGRIHGLADEDLRKRH